MADLLIDSFDTYRTQGVAAVYGPMKWDMLGGQVVAGRRAGGFALLDGAGIKWLSPAVAEWGVGFALYWSGVAMFPFLWGYTGGYISPHYDWALGIDALGRIYAREYTFVGGLWQAGATLFTCADRRMVANAWNCVETKQVGATGTIRINKKTAGSGTLASDAQTGIGFSLHTNLGLKIDDWDLYSIDAETPDFKGDIAIEAYVMASTDTGEWDPSQVGAENYEMVDDVPSDEEGTFNRTDQANKTDLFMLDPAGITDLTLQVFGAQLSVRAEHVNTSSMDIVPVVVSGVTESLGPRWGLGVGYGTFIHPLASNPATGLPWTVGEILAAKFGYRSLAPAG